MANTPTPMPDTAPQEQQKQTTSTQPAMRRILAVAALFVLAGCAYTYSDGERGGQVVKFSRKGLFTKSWEGQINLGGMSEDSKGNAIPNIFEFSVDEQQPNFPAIRATLDSALTSGARVRVWYRQAFQANPLRYDTDYLLDSARIAR